MVRDPRRPRNRLGPRGRLRGGLRSAPPRQRTRSALPYDEPVAQGDRGSALAGGPASAEGCAPRNRARRSPRPRGRLGRPRVRARIPVGPGVLHRGDVARRAEPVPRGRFRRGSPRGRCEDPPRRELDVHGGRGRERRGRGANQREGPTGGCEPRGPARQPLRARGAGPQQGDRRGRPEGPRLEPQLGPHLGHGEPGDRDPPRGRGPRGEVPRRAPTGLGHGRRPGVPDPGSVGRRRALCLRGRRVRGLAPYRETGPQRSKARRADGNACPRANCSPPPTWRSSGTAP